MLSWGTIVLSTPDNGGVRLVLLSCVLVAVVLLLAGSTIAVLTWVNQRRASVASDQLENI